MYGDVITKYIQKILENRDFQILVNIWFPLRVRNFVIVRRRLASKATRIGKSGPTTCYTILGWARVRTRDMCRLKLSNEVE